MASVLLSFVFLCLGIVLTILAAVLGAWLQHRYWGEQHRQKLENSHKTEALEIAKQLAGLMDRRLFRQRRLLWAVRSGKGIQEATSDYLDALFQWNDNFGRMKAGLWTSFGYDRVLEFENDIHSRFQLIGVRIEGALRGTVPVRELGQEENKLDRLGRDYYEFIQSLLKTIERDDFLMFHKKFRVSHSNWTNLSTISSYKDSSVFPMSDSA